MNESTDYSRLSEIWLYWARLAGLANAWVSNENAAYAISFISDDYLVHLRRNAEWWIIDTVDDRGQLHSDTAKLSTYNLVEKYLIWQWSSTARGVLRQRRLGPQLYALGLADNVEAVPIEEGIYELRTAAGRAVVMEPSATIFSHLMVKSLDDIEQFVLQDL